MSQSTNVPSSQPTPGVMNNTHSPSFLQHPPGTAPIMNISSITTPTRTPIRVPTSQTHSFIHGISHSPNAAPERDPHGSPNEIPTPVIPTPVILTRAHNRVPIVDIADWNKAMIQEKENAVAKLNNQMTVAKLYPQLYAMVGRIRKKWGE